MKRLALVAAALVVAGCEPVVTNSASVPVLSMLAETAERPYVCLNYEASSDSCETLSTVDVLGNRIRYSVLVAVPGGTARVVSNAIVRGNADCLDASSTTVTVSSTTLPPNQADVLVDVFKAHNQTLDGVCGTYASLGNHRYAFTARSPDGRVLPALNAEIQFFAESKSLRAPGV